MGKKRVLIVEDEIILSLVLEQMITQMGHTVVDKVTTGEMAIEKALEEQPDLIFMDIHLSGEMDGIEAVSEIQQKIEVSVIYITASTSYIHEKRIRKTSFLDFLTKPVTRYQLSDSLEMVS
jgi:CheY-like chemotaxis protein